MNRVELFLKNGILYKRLDFDDNLTINKTFYDLSNPYKSQLGYSFSSKLPLTKLNRELLGYDVKVNKKYDVKIYVNDIEITDGYIIIQNKNSKELTFNYVDASSEILSRLDRDYIFNATIDTEAIMGRNYLIPSNIYNVMDYPLLIDIINSSTPYKIGVANDGKKDLYLYVTDLISFNETLTPESKKISTRYTSYENDLTNAPVIFSKNNFYLSVNVEFLLNTLFDDHLDNYKVLSNSNAFRDFIKNNYVILKKDS